MWRWWGIDGRSISTTGAAIDLLLSPLANLWVKFSFDANRHVLALFSLVGSRFSTGFDSEAIVYATVLCVSVRSRQRLRFKSPCQHFWWFADYVHKIKNSNGAARGWEGKKARSVDRERLNP